MHRILSKCWLLLMFLAGPLLAQDIAIRGQVTSSDDNSPLPGVSVQVRGTTRGSSTDADGRYQLSVPAGSRLIFSFIGYGNQEVTVGNQTTINVVLTAGAQNLDEVVVTAQGIERDKRSLGYSIQEVSGAALSQRSEPNLLNGLQGKVAGVNITSSSGAPGASTNINIRGITSFTGSNQPLIVVDGIIFNNSTDATQNTLFGAQSSNRLSDINPESIESINVLKGPAAAVLYGSRASAGAIVITTKTGRNAGGKTEVTVTSSYNIQNVYGLPKFQNDYGQGLNNLFVNNQTNSWGPAFAGGPTSVTNIQGQVVPYQAYPNNIRDFYKQGSIIDNAVNLRGGDATKNFSLLLANTSQNGTVPNSKFIRTNVGVQGATKLQNGISLSGTANYVQTVQQGTPIGNGGSAFGQVTRVPRSYNLAGEPFQDAAGNSIYFTGTPSPTNVGIANNPLWSAYNEVQRGQVDRFFGNVIVGYDVAKWLNVSYRVTADTYTDRRKISEPIYAGRYATGAVIQDNIFRAELNGDLLINAHKDDILLKGLNANLLLGNNINQRRFQENYLQGDNLTIPGFYNISNASVFTNSSESTSLRRLVGYYGQLSLNYNNFAFLELSGRADQSSTLPTANNTYFYPAAAISFVPTDAFKLNSDILSYAKVRVSAARVGRDADPYQLNTLYGKAGYGNNVASITFPLAVGASGSTPGFQIGTQIGSNNLTPEFVTSYEAGINLGLFRNRLSIDATVFDTRSTNQIFPVAVSPSSGYDTRLTNVGELSNKGFELTLNTTPVRAGGFKWDITLNYTLIRNKVISISEGVPSAPIPGGTFSGITPSIVVGQPYGTILSSAYPRVQSSDPKAAYYDASGQYAGQVVINGTTGLFAPALTGQVVSIPQSRYTAGLTNSFSYKGLNLSVLVDTRQGGQIYSFVVSDQLTRGALAVTGVDRDQPRILTGAIQNADGTFRPNNIQLSAQTYWSNLGGLASETAAFDATVYRLREVSFSYALPKTLLGRSPFGGISVGVSGRNLLFYAPHYIGDPEVNTQGAGNIQGLDINGPTNTRNYGANVRLTF